MGTKIIGRTIIGILLFILVLPAMRSYFFDAGLRWEYILVFSFLSAFFITPFCRLVALRLDILDKPDWRKIHDQATPLLGGFGVYLAFTASLMLNNIFFPGMKVLLFGATLIFIMGLWDDIRPLPALLKFIFQILIALFVSLWGDIHMTFFFHASWSHLLNIPFTILWMVGLTNALNFFDGIDVLAAGMSIISALFLGIIAFKTQQPALGWFAVGIVGACAGFSHTISGSEIQPFFFWGMQGALFWVLPWRASLFSENGPSQVILFHSLLQS